MKDLVSLRRVGESALRHLADMFADDTNPLDPTDVTVDVTIVFADIESFSDVVAREGDDAATDVLDRLDRAVEAVLADTGARLVKRLGDGVMIAADAHAEGVRIAADLPTAFDGQMQDMPFPLRLRVGAHRGTVRRRGEDLIGYPVNVAARVAEQATGGTALITGALLEAAATDPDLVATASGHLVAKGVPERPPLHRIDRPSGAATTPTATPA